MASGKSATATRGANGLNGVQKPFESCLMATSLMSTP